ncbi:MAG: putative lipid II flippase FtsW [Anaerovoracaceae bacterium]
MKKNTKNKLKPIDFGLVSVTLGLIIFGVVMVFSASYYWALGQDGSPYAYLIKSGIWACGGIGIMFIVAMIDYRRLKNLSTIIMIASIVALALIFTPLGSGAKGATRWLDLGIITIMPGEISKLAAIIFVAAFLSKKGRNVNSLVETILPLLLLCGAYGGLIMLQPNMSTAVTIVGIIIAMMFIAGIKLYYFGGLIGVGAALGVAMISTSEYRLARATSFLNPFKDAQGDGFQVVQSLLALGSGGFWGRGLGNSIQKSLYLPEPQNDFILSIIGEELGFVGITFLLMAYIFLIWRGIKVALAAKDKFGFYIASGVVMMIGIQVALNIAVVTSSMPPTGVTLPFVSYGGNAMILFCTGMGLVLSVSRRTVDIDEDEEL